MAVWTNTATTQSIPQTRKLIARLLLRSSASVLIRRLESGWLLPTPMTQRKRPAMNDKSVTAPARLLTIREVAGYLQVDEKTIRRWIGARNLPAFKLGRQWRVAEKDLQRFLNERWTG